MMRENEINKIIADAMRDAPVAPDELRHNVMVAISELAFVPKAKKRNIFKTASALTGIAVFAVIVIAVGMRITKNGAPPAMSIYSGTGSATLMDAAIPEDSNDTADGYVLEDETTTAVQGSEKAFSETAQSSGVTYLITGELPIELAGLEYTENPDGSRKYENVPDEIIELLRLSDADIDGTQDADSKNVIKWSP